VSFGKKIDEDQELTVKELISFSVWISRATIGRLLLLGRSVFLSGIFTTTYYLYF